MDKALSLLGMARKAGRLEIGFTAAKAAARAGKARLLLAAADVSPKTFKELSYEAQRASIPAARLTAAMEELSHAVGVKTGVVGVTDQGFAKALIKAMEPIGKSKEENRL